jgi:hypothetical protein
MTRGREDNVAHLVADTADNARAQWVEIFARDRADLGPRHAAGLATQDIDRYGNQPDTVVGHTPFRTRPSTSVALQAAALRDEHARRHARTLDPHPPTPTPDYGPSR